MSGKKDTLQFTGTAFFEEHNAVTAKNKSIRKYQVVTHSEETKLIRTGDAVSNSVFIKEPILPALQPLDTSANAVTVATLNKKLKVVHINELGDPVEESPGIARSADIHSFQLKLTNQEVYVNSSLASRKSRFTIFKINNFSKLK